MIWRIKRYFVKCYVVWFINRYCKFIEENDRNRTNMNYAKARLMRAKIQYWKTAFSPWGDYNLFGYRCFAFSCEQIEQMKYEMREIGFHAYEKYFWKNVEG
jgi:hypothetical protein